MKLFFIFLLVIIFPGLTYAKSNDLESCREKTQKFNNKDQTQLFIQEKCFKNKKTVSVFTQKPSGQKVFSDLVLKNKEIIHLDFSIIDFDKDGYGDLDISTGVCGAGPNCEHDIYRYDPKTQKLYYFFNGGYVDLFVMDNYLIESGRSSAAAWEYHVYKMSKAPHKISEQDIEMRIVVDAGGVSEKQAYDAICKFLAPSSQLDDEKTLSPPNQKWLKLCEVYGKSYYLYSSEPVTSNDSYRSKILDLKQEDSSLKELLPRGWTLFSKAEGDLNQDGLQDLVFVIQNTNSKNIQKNESSMGEGAIDLNPRILAIYLKDKNSKRYVKQGQYDDFILLRDSPTMEEPFKELKIDNNGVLKISFYFWFSLGSWSTSNHHYKFRFHDNEFQLIGYDSSDLHRGSGEQTDYSINFLTRKMKISKGHMDKDQPESIQWKKFKLKKLKTLRELKKPFEWEFMGISI